MPRAKRFHLAQKLAIVALGAATLAIAGAGQLPAQAAYGPPPPPPPPAPGGFVAVVAVKTIGPAGGAIGPVNLNGCRAFLTVPAGTFSTPVQVTITAPQVQGIGTGGHPGYRPVCGVGVLVEVNGKPYSGKFGHPLTLEISGVGITSRDRVAVWNGSTFQFVGATVSGHAVLIRFTGPGEDFVVLAPTGGGFAASRGVTAAVIQGGHLAREAVVTSLFLAPAGLPQAGIGVLAPEWVGSRSR